MKLQASATTRPKLCVAMLLSAFLGIYASAPAHSAEADQTPELEFLFEELVTLGPDEPVGATPYGDRNIIPITGGRFEGPKMKGEIVPGGWDWQLAASGGCKRLEADYMIKTDDGVVINVLNIGTFCTPPDGGPAHIFTTPVFEAPMGKYDWLNGGAYVGTVARAEVNGERAVRIRFYRAK